MSIPYNEDLSLSIFRNSPDWHKGLNVPLSCHENQFDRAVSELLVHTFIEPIVRSIQHSRDLARLVLKVPVRALATPVFLEKNWAERERAKINAKLAGYSFVQMVSVPVKFVVALIALATLAFSHQKARKLLNSSEEWTTFIDGRTSQLEALKEEGAKKAKDQNEFNEYRAWIYGIPPQLCRKTNVNRELS